MGKVSAPKVVTVAEAIESPLRSTTHRRSRRRVVAIRKVGWRFFYAAGHPI
jgi:hypothetical protein